MDSRSALDHTGGDPIDPPISVSRLLRTLRRYAPAIILTLVSVAVIYALMVVAYMLSRPSQTVTSIRFRLNFAGADNGTYPNGSKFNASTMISTPVLLKVWRANDLKRYCSFDTFAQSVVVLEANPALERLNAEYQARLADPKLSPIDRDRISREFDLKRDSLGKNEYAISYSRHEGAMPETVVRKTLSDILVTWSNDAENEQRLLDYPMAVLSPDVLDNAGDGTSDPMISLLILRSKINRILGNISELQLVPGAETIRSPTRKMSLLEVRLRLEDILRFRVEPLLATVRSSGLIRNPTAMVAFLETQLAHDELALRNLQARSEAIRSSLSVYTMSAPAEETRTADATQPQLPPRSGMVKQAGGDSVTPIVNEGFLDRLVAMSNQGDEVRYRQKVAADYQHEVLAVIPAEQAVAYDKALLEQMKRVPAGASTVPPAQIGNDIENIRNESRTLVAQVNEIYQILSRTMNPASQVYSVTQAATTTIQRTGDLRRSGLGLVLVLLVTLPIAVFFALLHNRVREEETAEEELVEAAETKGVKPSAA